MRQGLQVRLVQQELWLELGLELGQRRRAQRRRAEAQDERGGRG